MFGLCEKGRKARSGSFQLEGSQKTSGRQGQHLDLCWVWGLSQWNYIWMYKNEFRGEMSGSELLASERCLAFVFL